MVLGTAVMAPCQVLAGEAGVAGVPAVMDIQLVLAVEVVEVVEVQGTGMEEPMEIQLVLAKEAVTAAAATASLGSTRVRIQRPNRNTPIFHHAHHITIL